MYKMEEERDIEPKTLAHMISSTLYQRRYDKLSFLTVMEQMFDTLLTVHFNMIDLALTLLSLSLLD